MKSGEEVGRGELVVVGLTVELAVGGVAVVEGVGVFGAIPLRIPGAEKELRDWEWRWTERVLMRSSSLSADLSHSIRACGKERGAQRGESEE